GSGQSATVTATVGASSQSVIVTITDATSRVPAEGLIGYWAFDDGVGTSAQDASGAGHNGVVNAANWTAGKTNSALAFNGSSSDVVTPAIPLGNVFSVSAWVNPAV